MTLASQRIPRPTRAAAAPTPSQDFVAKSQSAWTAITDGLNAAFKKYGCLPMGTRASSLWCVPSAETTALVDARVARIATAHNNDEKNQAIYELSQVYGPRVVDFVLASLLRIQDYDTHRTIIQAMGRRRVATPEVVMALANLIESPSRGDGWSDRASRALRQIGPAAIPILVAAMKEGKGVAAVRALTFFGDPVYPDIMAALIRGDEHVQENVLSALDEMGVYPKVLVPVAVSLLTSVSQDVRFRVLKFLGHSGTRDTTVLTAIIASMGSYRFEVSRAAVEAIGDLGIPTAQANMVLRACIRENKDGTRYGAFFSLGKIGGQDPKSVALLFVVAKGDSSEEHQGTAIAALGMMRPVSPEAIQVAINYLDDSQFAYVAGGALVKMGQAAVPALVEKLESGWQGDGTKSQAARILSRMGPRARAALPALHQIVKDPGTGADLLNDVQWAIREIEKPNNTAELGLGVF